MKPIEFKEQTNVVRGDHLQNADGSPMGNLPAYVEPGRVISCWKGDFWDRLRFLFTGEMWMSIHSNAIPPSSLQTESPFVPVTEVTL